MTTKTDTITIELPKAILPILKTYAKERGEPLEIAIENALYTGMSRKRTLARYAEAQRERERAAATKKAAKAAAKAEKKRG